MKALSITVTIILSTFLWTNPVKAQIKNSKTAVVTIYGNCGMCKNTIEKAANISKQVKVNWNMETKKATLSYNSKVTNADEVLKRVALAGYDNEHYRAPDEVYAKLHQCCLYDRPENSTAKQAIVSKDGNSKSRHTQP